MVLIQLIAVLSSVVYSAVVTFIIIKVIKAVSDIRVTDKDEQIGLDVTEHGEEAYGGMNI